MELFSSFAALRIVGVAQTSRLGLRFFRGCCDRLERSWEPIQEPQTQERGLRYQNPNVKVAKAIEITATVPSGATSGKVKVATPDGALTSNVNFRVP
jgi:hypothetical protein